MSRQKPVGTFLLLFAALSLSVAAISAERTRRFKLKAAAATGSVIRVDQRQRKDSTTYHPVFTFRDQRGSTHTAVSSVGNSKIRWRVGDAIPILYDPENPSDARVTQGLSLWLIPFAFLIIGAGALLAAVVFGAVRRRWNALTHPA